MMEKMTHGVRVDEEAVAMLIEAATAMKEYDAKRSEFAARTSKDHVMRYKAAYVATERGWITRREYTEILRAIRDEEVTDQSSTVEKTIDCAKKLEGMAYYEWQRLRHAIDRAFDAQKGELLRDLKLDPADEVIRNAW